MVASTRIAASGVMKARCSSGELYWQAPRDCMVKSSFVMNLILTGRASVKKEKIRVDALVHYLLLEFQQLCAYITLLRCIRRTIMTKTDHKHKEAVVDVPLTAVFVRHAQAAAADEGTRSLGPLLSSLGERQAERVSKRLAEESFTHIYSSDLLRAKQTALAILKHQEDVPWTVTAELREVSPHHFAPGYIQLTLAMRREIRAERAAMDKFVAHVRRAHVPGEKILIVCHGNLIRSIVPLFARRSPDQAVMMDINNTAVTILDIWPSGEAVLRLSNCVKHLIPREVT